MLWAGEAWGWCVGRITTTTDQDFNFAALCTRHHHTAQHDTRSHTLPPPRADAGNWREDHTLTIDAYGTSAARGSWTLLQPTRAASPILDYKNGKFKKAGG